MPTSTGGMNQVIQEHGGAIEQKEEPMLQDVLHSTLQALFLAGRIAVPNGENCSMTRCANNKTR
jgi:hypothetical protein